MTDQWIRATSAKSISAENTFLTDTDDRTILRAALKDLAADVAQTLEQNQVGALTIQVKVRYSNFTTFRRQLRVEDPITPTADIYRLAQYLLARRAPPTKNQLRLPI